MCEREWQQNVMHFNYRRVISFIGRRSNRVYSRCACACLRRNRKPKSVHISTRTLHVINSYPLRSAIPPPPLSLLLAFALIRIKSKMLNVLARPTDNALALRTEWKHWKSCQTSAANRTGSSGRNLMEIRIRIPLNTAANSSTLCVD